jgi:hypothetical protein
MVVDLGSSGFQVGMQVIDRCAGTKIGLLRQSFLLMALWGSSQDTPPTTSIDGPDSAPAAAKGDVR